MDDLAIFGQDGRKLVQDEPDRDVGNSSSEIKNQIGMEANRNDQVLVVRKRRADG